MNQRPTLAKISYTQTTVVYLNELVDLLYQKYYFSYRESSRQYVISLINDMEATLHLKMKRKASPYFSRYGKNLWYVFYTRNKNTTWYFFFTIHANDTYVIRYITNNHVAGHLV